MIYTPVMNDGNHVFVFGSNTRGIHGAGAAKDAYRNWGAVLGDGIGRTGNAYAIPTKDSKLATLKLSTIDVHVSHFLNYAEAHPELIFLVTKIGCGLAGCDEKDIAPMFHNAPSNCVLPEGWKSNQ